MKFEWIVMFTIIHHSLTEPAYIDETLVDFPDNCTGYINGTDLTCNNTNGKLLFTLSHRIIHCI